MLISEVRNLVLKATTALSQANADLLVRKPPQFCYVYTREYKKRTAITKTEYKEEIADICNPL
jgi:hypothetical protein